MNEDDRIKWIGRELKKWGWVDLEEADGMRGYFKAKARWHEKQIRRHQERLKRMNIAVQFLDELCPPFAISYRGNKVRCSTLAEVAELDPNIRTISDYKRHRNKLAWNGGVNTQ